MRIFLIIALLSVICSCTKTDKNNIIVNVEVQNMTIPRLGLLYNRTGSEITLDKNGKGSAVLKGVGNLYATLFYGETPKFIFLQKGDELNISFNGRDYKNSFKVEGKNAAVIDYLNTVQYTEIPRGDYALPLADYNAKIEQKIKEATTLLKARKLDEVNPSFVSIEEDRIKFLYAGSLLMYPMGRVFVANDTAYRPDEVYYNTLAAWLTEKEELADVEAYRTFVEEAALVLSSRGNELSGGYAKTLCKMRYIAENFKNEKLKQVLLQSLALRYLEENGIKGITDLENIYNTYVTEPELKAAYKAVYDSWDISSPGRISPDFEAQDVDGKSYTLKDFQGKYLYIDLWATWCGPCKKELPALKELEKKFKGKNIIFLGLSLDDDKAAWETMVNSGVLTGAQLLLGKEHQFTRDYNVDGIPRFILLDMEGKIVNDKMLHPSSPDIEGVLNSLAGI